MMAMVIALQWVEEVRPERVVIASDSCAALNSLQFCHSRCREDLLFEIMQSLFRIQKMQLSICFVWIPAHIGIDGNERADKAAKRALKSGNHIDVNLSKSEAKVVIKGQIKKRWQNEWNKESKGRYLFKNKPLVGSAGTGGRNRKEESVITRLRNGHSALNSSLFLIGKHNNGRCEYCGEEETVDHVLLYCQKYESEREVLKNALGEIGEESIINTLRKHSGDKCWILLLEYLTSTKLINRI